MAAVSHERPCSMLLHVADGVESTMGLLEARALVERLGWTNKLRPMAVGAFVADMLAPARRTIVESEDGLSFYIDPLSNFGRTLVSDGRYEPKTEQLIREHLAAGDSFLDVGANEGYFSVVAAKIVGLGGYVAAVEPQGRLCDVIRINLALNEVHGAVFHGALGGATGETTELFHAPALNTGYSSVVKRPKFTRSSETVTFLDPAGMLGGRERFALVKVDVEGFEDGVVRSLLPLLQQGKVGALLLDYHAPILAARGVDPVAIERSVLDAGMKLVGEYARFGDYRLYVRG
ncbi:FkbM family methyltransferase [Granulicella sp. 5B5]|uniref:FkbM family methyltransferase n=1 Tax=Granulicella sp. 5B5 TaxID=1617967 RepID=UPI0015F46840|nr:FkbM family methyltransferase [Granulicella sp. 5B5]QMV18025.1 FkbM family methyltransferase [Granulicella sp. 5B5]